jgi:hypothetical protein
VKELAAKELELAAHDGLMWRAIVNVEVIDVRINADFAFRSLARGFDGKLRLGDLIVRGNANQPRATKRSGVVAHTIRRLQ